MDKLPAASRRHDEQLLSRHVDELAASAVPSIPAEASPAARALQRLDRLQQGDRSMGLSR